MSAYATAADYAAFMGLTYPGDWDAAEILRIDAGLAKATSDIDSSTYFSRIDYTDAASLEGLKLATCARFEYMETTGDDGSGSFGLFDSVGIGTVSLSRGAGRAAAQKADPLSAKLGPRAATYLRNAGLAGGGVYEA